jgi:hypothetical protein
LKIKIDLLLRDADGQAICVLDAKYKIAEQPKLSDCEQVVAYAGANGCREAILVCPARMEKGIDLQWGEVRLRTLSFDLAAHLDVSGANLLAGMCAGVSPAAADLSRPPVRGA